MVSRQIVQLHVLQRSLLHLSSCSLDIADREERQSVMDVLRKGFNRGRRVGGMHRFKEQVGGGTKTDSSEISNTTRMNH